MFKGFKPKLSKNESVTTGEKTINLNPELVIVNDPRTTPDGKSLNGQKVFTSLNMAFAPAIQDFFHALGLTLNEVGEDVELPGYFDGDATNPDPTKWGTFQGQAVNETAVLELAEIQASKKVGNSYVPDPTKTRTDIKRYVCRVPGCTVQHMESLIRS
ncbi:MAG: hypothetical protein WAK20_06620 [Candidatus Acidiferrum sp.]